MTQAGDGLQRPQREPTWATQVVATLPATSMLEPWPKKSCRSIFRAYSPDERFRLSDSRSGARPFARLTSFNASIASCSAGAAAADDGSSKAPAEKAQAK